MLPRFPIFMAAPRVDASQRPIPSTVDPWRDWVKTY